MENNNQLPVGPEQLLKFMGILQQYSAGIRKTKDRVIAAESWWTLRNTAEAAKVSDLGSDGGFTSQSGWLHNVIVSKHADAMDAFPHPVFLPREEGDVEEARMLSKIVPCILEQNDFEDTYSAAMWQKTKTGTGVYKILWDPDKLGGLGDISIHNVSVLNLYWQPEIRDIQDSPYFFQTEPVDRVRFSREYPGVLETMKPDSFVCARFLNDEHSSGNDRITVIEVYYHKTVNGKNTLQYCKFAGDQVLFATENMLDPELDELGNAVRPPMAETGLYDHAMYPYQFDPLFPVEGSPCGYGYVDICKNPQITIDLMKTAFLKNALVGATPRYFGRQDAGVKMEDFLDLSKAIIPVTGNIDARDLRPVDFVPLPQVYVNVLNDTIQELRETSGNTETSTGNIASGVTAAAAIAALQQASGKGSRDSSRASYRAFARMDQMIVELIRQFYTLPRQFRLLGDGGDSHFVSYDNSGLLPQDLGADFGQELGYRVPAFDIQITAQKKDAYSAMAQNEMALQFYQLGFFQPQRAEEALQCLAMMDFDQKDSVMEKIARAAEIWKIREIGEAQR